MKTMMGELKSKNTRTVYNKKVVTLTIEVPFNRVKTQKVEGDRMLEWLDARVGSDIGVNITSLDDQRQKEVTDGR